MKVPSLVAIAALLLSFASCVTHNYTFADRDGPLPDVEVMERARQEKLAQGDDRNSLGDVFWYPFVALHAEVYGASTALWPKGTAYGNFTSYGPLFLFADAEAMHYDEQQKLYERNLDSQYLWGLWRTERDDVRVPSGWRVATETSILFGLLRWPSESYVSSLPFDEPAPSDG